MTYRYKRYAFLCCLALQVVLLATEGSLADTGKELATASTRVNVSVPKAKGEILSTCQDILFTDLDQAGLFFTDPPCTLEVRKIGLGIAHIGFHYSQKRAKMRWQRAWPNLTQPRVFFAVLPAGVPRPRNYSHLWLPAYAFNYYRLELRESGSYTYMVHVKVHVITAPPNGKYTVQWDTIPID